MNAVSDALSTQSSFVVAALGASWIAVVFLGLVAANLHVRLAHLEQGAGGGAEARTPYGELIGLDLAGALGPPADRTTRLALVLSSNCTSCQRILDWLGSRPAPVPLALIWRHGDPGPASGLPPGAVLLADGARISTGLGVRVTPFALAADHTGHIVKAQPVGSVAGLAALIDELGLDHPDDRPTLTPHHQPLKGATP